MKTMILALTLGLLLSCTKEALPVNYLPGKWNLIETELYENGALKASDIHEELNTVYYFSSCETGNGSFCDMYIEEDGEQQVYTYSYDETNANLVLDGVSNFVVESLSNDELTLVRFYDSYKSTYRFRRG